MDNAEDLHFDMWEGQFEFVGPSYERDTPQYGSRNSFAAIGDGQNSVGLAHSPSLYSFSFFCTVPGVATTGGRPPRLGQSERWTLHPSEIRQRRIGGPSANVGGTTEGHRVAMWGTCPGKLDHLVELVWFNTWHLGGATQIKGADSAAWERETATAGKCLHSLTKLRERTRQAARRGGQKSAETRQAREIARWVGRPKPGSHLWIKRG